MNQKYSILFIFILLLAGCSSSSDTKPPEAPILTNVITREMLNNDQYPWFKIGYDSFEPAANVLVKINNINDFKVYIFLGTWCSDSKREVPKFFKIMDKLGFSNMEMIGLDKKKKSSEGTEVTYKIEKVPTFIFYSNNKESGRIVEIPEKTLEEDILKIVQQNNN